MTRKQGERGTKGTGKGQKWETKDKDTNRHDGRCREMTRNERTGHTWKMKLTYREHDRDMKGELKGMEGI